MFPNQQRKMAATGGGSAAAVPPTAMFTIGLRNFINLILVKEGVRPAFLLQPAEYGEARGNDEVTSNVLREIRKVFPDLKFSEEYKIYQGILISKEDFNGRDDITLNEMGRILGYPCYSDFGEEDLPFSLGLEVEVQKISSGKKIKELLFVNKCKDESKKALFERIAARASTALAKPENKEMLKQFDIRIISFGVEKKMIHNELTLLKKLIDEESFDEEERFAILNVLFNRGFSFESQIEFDDNFQYNNPIHRGILMGILVDSKYDRIQPFYPLQEQPKSTQAEIEETTEKWFKSLISTIVATKTKPIESGKKTRRARRSCYR